VRGTREDDEEEEERKRGEAWGIHLEAGRENEPLARSIRDIVIVLPTVSASLVLVLVQQWCLLSDQ
jgi:hypothetical protein